MPQLRDKQLSALLKQGESESVEFCESPQNTKDKIAKNICAFSNDMSDSRKPGVIFIGVKDNGECVNLTVTDEMLRNISDIKFNGNIQPHPVMNVRKVTLDQPSHSKKCEMIVVEVQPHSAPPVQYKGRCWIRTGPSIRQASEEDERRLTEKRQSSHLPFDTQGVPDSSESDLNRDYLKTHYLPSAVSRKTLQANNRDSKTQMQSLRLLDSRGYPTAGALLILGKTPRNHFPGAYIQFIRFEGKKLTDPVRTQEEVSGTLPDQIQRIEDILKAHISKPLTLTDTTHIQATDYPIEALSQLVRNAVIHRDYNSTNPVRIYWFSDRIEIQSPGGLYGEVNKDNFGKEGVTSYRNPVIAEALKNLGFIERFGFGIPLTKKELKENGNPNPEFAEKGAFVWVLVKPKKFVVKKEKNS